MNGGGRASVRQCIGATITRQCSRAGWGTFRQGSAFQEATSREPPLLLL